MAELLRLAVELEQLPADAEALPLVSDRMESREWLIEEAKDYARLGTVLLVVVDLMGTGDGRAGAVLQTARDAIRGYMDKYHSYDDFYVPEGP